MKLNYEVKVNAKDVGLINLNPCTEEQRSK
jgi:hypothetical protein